MTSEQRLRVLFEMPATHRYFVAAWSFLEDAVSRTKAETRAHKRVFHLQRLLGACAVNLRLACEAQYGEKRLSRAPDQSLMFFVTAARHLAAHAVNDPGSGTVTRSQAEWSNESGTGTLEAEIVLDIDVEQSDLEPHEKEQARKYLLAHGNDAFLALHTATATISTWVGEKVDDDFWALRNHSAGRFIMRHSISNAEEFQAFLAGMTGLPFRDSSEEDGGSHRS